MAEEQDQAVEQDKVAEPNELEVRIAELENRYKSEIKGLNRRISEREKELKAYEREKMSEEEKREAERKELEEARVALERERKSFTTQKLIESELQSVGLSLDFAKRIHGETEDEIKADVQALNELFNSNVTKVAEKTINERLSGKSPKSGEETKNTLTRTEFDALSDYEKAAKIKAGISIVEG